MTRPGVSVDGFDYEGFWAAEVASHDARFRGRVLADLRAGVEALRAKDLGPAGTPAQAGYDCGRADAFAEVLALMKQERPSGDRGIDGHQDASGI